MTPQPLYIWRANVVELEKCTLGVRGLQDWQGDGTLPTSGAAVCAVIKRKRSEREGEAATERLMLTKRHCHWFQAAPHVQLKLAVWKQVLSALSRAHQKGEPIR